ncbi:MAG: hypothetical protein CVV64_02860 [Candidatus Wallbacteria bacterium HGW-Wallbacteria-1]|jgi:serine/threonine protein kinase|uniref:Protein kinase domain-containing protein n=1 Tax=Candidatus Wallbacteria bacterium HGW-Wallbacteria-1 TaxID=2013854 RepID=A0A2N1PTF7_9BACT|nr:MAG: hypothetical protein CVV64_02860 [Candidatus Wallbacteria bacterium HGW-Wallbacteria-1]
MVPIKLIRNLDSADPETTKEMILQIGECSDPRAVEYLEPLLKHKNVGVRYFTKKVIDRLIRLPIPEGPFLDSESQRSPIAGTGHNADEDNSPLPDVPATAFERIALARGKAYATETGSNSNANINDALVEEYITKLDSSASQDRLEAIFNLKRFVNEEVGISLLELCDREKDPLVLSVLVKVLPEFYPCLLDATVQRLTTALTSDDPRVRANSVEALEQIWFEHKERSQVPDIFKLVIPLVSDSDNRVKANALKFLFSFDRSLVLAELNTMIDESEIWMKDSALYALGEIRDTAVIPILLKASLDANEEIRLKAVGKLAAIGTPDALLPLSEVFVQALSDDVHEMNFIADMVLDRLGERLIADSADAAPREILLGFLTCAMEHGEGAVGARIMSNLLSNDSISQAELTRSVEILMKTGNSQACVNFYEPIFRELLARFPSEAARFAEFCIMSGHFSKAMDIYEKVVAANPDNATNLYRLGEISLINGMYDRAVRSLEKALHLGGCSAPHARKLLAEACLRKGAIKRALTEGQDCMKLCLTMEDAETANHLIYELACSFAETGQSLIALSMFRTISGRNPDFRDIADKISFLANQSSDLLAQDKDIPEENVATLVKNPNFADELTLEDARTIILFDQLPSQNISDERENGNPPQPKNRSIPKEPLKTDQSQNEPPRNTVQAAQGLDISPEEFHSIRERIDNRYTGLRLIGRGGMGLVFHARDTRLSREVALKVLPEYLCNESESLARFLREAQAVARLNHFNLVQIYDIVIQQQFAYLVMEFIDGLTVRQLLKKKGKIPLNVLKNIASQLCQALINAHDATVIHRDIKPDNLMVNRGGKLKVMDFGLAKGEFCENITRVGSVLGTSIYMAPEQITGSNPDKCSDIYSVGITLYEMAVGYPPFSKGNISYQHIHVKADPPSEKNRDLPAEFDRIILKCLSKKSEDRYQDCRDLLADIEKL